MTNEKRLIDANALMASLRESLDELREIGDGLVYDEEKKICNGQICTFLESIMRVWEQPTVDAVELPCKMGDTVWGIKAFNHGRLLAKQGIVHQMFFGDDMRLCICVKDVCRGEWGKNVFATKEEAEVAIGERRTDDG